MPRAKRPSDMTAEIVRELLDYDPETGVLTWRVRDVKWFKDGKRSAAHNCAIWNGKFAGHKAFTSISNGRFEGRILSRRYFANRVIWLLVYSEWPQGEVDHIDHDPLNNRILNLRDVGHQENGKNQSFRKTNTSGVMGVWWDSARGLWSACVKVDGRTKHLGRFAELSAAAEARKVAEVQHGYHPNHGNKRAA